METIDRRAFLKIAGVAGLALASGCRAEAPAGTMPTAAGLPATGVPSGLPSAPQRLVITPTGQLFTQSYSGTPAVEVADWRLRIGGTVERPVELTYSDVLAFPKVETVRTLECIGNPVGGELIGNPAWGGFLAAHLWEQVGIRPEAKRARFTGADGYRTAVDVEWITQPGVLLAYELNGETLPPAYGFPLRILMPGLYGQKMPKWLTDIEFIDGDFLGYWESLGWSDVAAVKTKSIIQQPRRTDRLSAGAVPVGGIAFAGLRRINAVQVRIDDGEWQEAELLQDESPWVWTQWSFPWEATPGEHEVAVRAMDDTGFVQSTEGGLLSTGAFPDGADGIHEVLLRVDG
jgi:DMSO/TMAO reductase YedYZ molybdopterin-dependent catalytic subunit